MLELRVKIQLLQSDHNFVAKARDDLKAELEALQQAHEAQQVIHLIVPFSSRTTYAHT